MMHWYLNEQREQILNVAREFAQEECRRAKAEVEKTNKPPVALFKRAAELGLVGMTWPEEYGGLGLDLVTYCLAKEEIAKELPVLNILIGGTTTLCGKHILQGGSEEIKKKYLPLAAKGDLIMAAGNCEAVGATNFSEFQTTAVPDGDFYVLNGSKIFTTNLDTCGAIIVTARTSPEVNPITGQGLSYIIVDKGMPGLEIGKIEEKLGWHGSSTGGFFLKNVRVPKTNRLGPEGIGNAAMVPVLAEENMTIGCECLGHAESLYLKTWDYLNSRVMRGVSLFNTSQVIRHRLLKMRVEIDSLRALVYGTATQADQGRPIIDLGNFCKFKGVEVLEYVGREAVQLHGGLGVVNDNMIDTGYRDARVGAIAGMAVEQIYDMVLGFMQMGMVPVL